MSRKFIAILAFVITGLAIVSMMLLLVANLGDWLRSNGYSVNGTFIGCLVALVVPLAYLVLVYDGDYKTHRLRKRRGFFW